MTSEREQQTSHASCEIVGHRERVHSIGLGRGFVPGGLTLFYGFEFEIHIWTAGAVDSSRVKRVVLVAVLVTN